MVKMKKRQFYCVLCQRKVTSSKDDMYVKVYKNKKSYYGETPALKSKCKRCDTNLTKWISYDNEEKYIDEFGI